jgi:uncharacterized membrane protein YeaQ/YmgE (transglycosylase-associated protein family)
MHILYFLILGAIVGWLAGLIMRGAGFGVLGDIVVGILGAILGGWVFGVAGCLSGRLVAGISRDGAHRGDPPHIYCPAHQANLMIFRA